MLSQTLVPPPTSGLASNHNYTLVQPAGEDCAPLKALDVQMAVSRDLVVARTDADQLGFSLQVNCWSAEANAAWQQFVVALTETDLHGGVQTWRAPARTGKMVSTFHETAPLRTIPRATVPAGWVLGVSLRSDPQSQVSGVTFSATDDRGKTTTAGFDLVPFGQRKRAPIVAVQVVLVGPAGGHTTTFSSGAGTLTVVGQGALKARSQLPDCVYHPNATGEKANSRYGAVPSGPLSQVQQRFWTSGA